MPVCRPENEVKISPNYNDCQPTNYTDPHTARPKPWSLNPLCRPEKDPEAYGQCQPTRKCQSPYPHSNQNENICASIMQTSYIPPAEHIAQLKHYSTCPPEICPTKSLAKPCGPVRDDCLEYQLERDRQIHEYKRQFPKYEPQNQCFHAEPPGSRTSQFYVTHPKLPGKFENPDWFSGYGCEKSPHPLYRTTYMEYGRYPPSVHTMPVCYFAKDSSFTKSRALGGPYTDEGLNTQLDPVPFGNEYMG